jgi:drug/metabolite transporter (DMT)-like permease
MYSYVNPIIAVLLGWLLLNEGLGWRVCAAMAIILGGVALVKTAPKREPQGGMMKDERADVGCQMLDVS